MDDLIGSNDCKICMGQRRVCVGISFPPKSTIAVKAEYDPCPGCTPGPHTFHAKRTAQRLQETRAKAAKGGREEIR